MPRELIFVLLLLAAGTFALAQDATKPKVDDPSAEADAEDAKPYGIQKRTLWTNSRVIGRPDPPPPFRLVRSFPELKFDRSLFMTQEPGSGRMLVVEQMGKVLGFPNQQDAAETHVFYEKDEYQLYSIYFDPNYAQSRQVYVFANGPHPKDKKQPKDPDNVIFRYRINDQQPPVCDMATEERIIAWKSNGHNGGQMSMGPDGCLYISSGDGTSDSDGNITGQDITDLPSGVLRIDVRNPDEGRKYSIPADNPFLEIEGARGELWAYGFRNPWRLTFDQKTGDLWVGDIGQDLWEYIVNVQRGGNYGWSVMEGSHPFYLERERGPTPISPPAVEHSHSEARSITGGLVYYGGKYPELEGVYIYGDYATGKVWGIRYVEGRVTWQQELADSTVQILAFATDEEGQIYVVDYAGAIYEFEHAPKLESTQPFPRRLSETGLFTDVAAHQVDPGLIPYSVNAPLWSDGAEKERYVAIPGEERVQYKARNAWQFPENTVLVKTFSLPMNVGGKKVSRRIETRLLHLLQGEWQGYSYLWNQEQTDAELIEDRGTDQTYAVFDQDAPQQTRNQKWHFPSRSECMICHSRASGFVLGLTTAQLNKPHDYGSVTDNQLRTLEHIGLIGRKKPGKEDEPKTYVADKLPKPIDELPRLVDPSDEAADLQQRARAYLHSNCAQCHVDAGGGNAAIVLHRTTDAKAMKMLNVPPLHHRFGIQDAKIVAPGQPEHSILLHRIAHRERGHMPPLGTNLVDEQAVELIRQWIKQLPETEESPK